MCGPPAEGWVCAARGLETGETGLRSLEARSRQRPGSRRAAIGQFGIEAMQRIGWKWVGESGDSRAGSSSAETD